MFSVGQRLSWSSSAIAGVLEPGASMPDQKTSLLLNLFDYLARAQRRAGALELVARASGRDVSSPRISSATSGGCSMSSRRSATSLKQESSAARLVHSFVQLMPQTANNVIISYISGGRVEIRTHRG